MNTVLSVEKIFDTPNGKIAAKLWGPETGKPVLAMHGWLDNAASFDGLAPLLAGVRIVAIDLPGHGLSDHRPNGAIYHFIDVIPSIVAVLDKLGWEKCNLLGHSMGAGLSLIFAGALPERVTKMALIEGLGPFSSKPEEMPERVNKFIAQTKLLSEKRLPIYASPDEAALARKKAGDLSEKSAQILVSRGLKKVADGYTWRSDPRLRLDSPMRMTEEQVLAFCRRVVCPTLLVRAESGIPFEKALVEARLKAMTTLKMVEVKGGHHVHLDTPDVVAPPVNSFF